MANIKPNAKLARLHDAFEKHAPTHEVMTVEFQGAHYKQYMCSCGYVFWDSDGHDQPALLAKEPTAAWLRCMYKAYEGTAMERRFKAYWLGFQKACVEYSPPVNQAFGLRRAGKPRRKCQ